MEEKRKISAVIITFNEERNIERCIKSLENVADEIIVVDSFSTDNTQAFCQKYNVKFVQQKWLGYAKQKNYANSLASYDLILSLDADEALSDELKNSILEIKKTSVPVAYSMNRCTNYCGKWIKHCGWYPDKKVRIFDKNFAFWKDLQIHEEIVFSVETPVIHLKGDILHYSYYTIQEHINQANKFTDLTAKVAFEKNKKSSLFNIFFNPKWKFFSSFIIKGGFLDGYYGYLVCKISANATFLKYAKLRELNKNK